MPCVNTVAHVARATVRLHTLPYCVRLIWEPMHWHAGQGLECRHLHRKQMRHTLNISDVNSPARRDCCGAVGIVLGSGTTGIASPAVAAVAHPSELVDAGAPSKSGAPSVIGASELTTALDSATAAPSAVVSGSSTCAVAVVSLIRGLASGRR